MSQPIVVGLFFIGHISARRAIKRPFRSTRGYSGYSIISVERRRDKNEKTTFTIETFSFVRVVYDSVKNEIGAAGCLGIDDFLTFCLGYKKSGRGR